MAALATGLVAIASSGFVRLGAQTDSVGRAATSIAAHRDEWYPATLDFGTGLIQVPTAWVSPANSDFWLSYGGMHMNAPAGHPGTPSHWNGNFAIDTHWLHRFDIGFSMYSNNPEWGFFGQVLAVREGQFASAMPAIAFGARNVGPFQHEDRFLLGTDVVVDSTGTHEQTPFYFKKLHTAPTLYAVATKSFAVDKPLLSSVSVSLGGGDGLFSDNGGLGASYSKTGTIVRGVFFGARTVTHPSTNTTVSLVAENDGWEWNAGVVGSWRGISASVYFIEFDKGGTVDIASYSLYNYRKVSIAFSYAGNMRDVANGHVLRTQITSLEHDRAVLRTDIAHRQKLIEELSSHLTELQQGEFGDSGKEKQVLEKELEAERAAMQRAADRLKQLEGDKR